MSNRQRENYVKMFPCQELLSGLTIIFFYRSRLYYENVNEYSVENYLYKVQLDPFVSENWNLKNYFPAAVSPNTEKQVLIQNSYMSSSLNLLDLQSERIQKLKSKSTNYTWDTVVWNSQSDGFLFTQPSFNFIKFAETTLLFYYDLNTQTKYLVSNNTSMSGGIAIPEKYVDVFVDDDNNSK